MQRELMPMKSAWGVRGRRADTRRLLGGGCCAAAVLCPFVLEAALGREVPLGIVAVVPVLLAALLLGRGAALSVCLLAIAASLATEMRDLAEAAVNGATFALVGAIVIPLVTRVGGGHDSGGIAAAAAGPGPQGEQSVRSSVIPIPREIRVIEVLGRQVVDEDSFCRLTSPLSRRQGEVVRLAVTGLTSRQIGSQLFISERTVETHLANAYDRLGVHSRGELIAGLSSTAGSRAS